MVMEESGIQESSGLETSHSRGEVVEVMNGALERDLMEETGELRLQVAIDLDLRSREISGMREMSGNFRLGMTGEIHVKGHSQPPPMRSLFADEVDSEGEEEAIGISVDAEGGRIPKSGRRLHPGAGPATEIGRGKCAMTEIVNVISKPIGGRMNFEGNARSGKGMIDSGESHRFVQTPGIRPVDNKRPSHLVQLQ